MTSCSPMNVSTEAHPLRHVAIIMDGNNRWATERGLAGLAGHRAGVERVRDTLEAARRHNVEVITLFAFSSENWCRPPAEVRGLMSLFDTYLRSQVTQLIKQDTRLLVIGRRDRLSPRMCKLIEDSERRTATGSRTLVLAVDYGGRWDVAQAAQSLARRVQQGELAPDDIDEASLSAEISLSDLPPPDLCIRTAGEQRISNFLLWQLAYSELYFAPCYWPDFDQSAFDRAVADYRSRQRRFGGRIVSSAHEEQSV